MSWATANMHLGLQSPAHAAVLLTHALQVGTHATCALLHSARALHICTQAARRKEPPGSSAGAHLPPSATGIAFCRPVPHDRYGEPTAALQGRLADLASLPRSQGGEAGSPGLRASRPNGCPFAPSSMILSRLC